MSGADPMLPRTVLVTGGSKRIGRAICERLAADGWAVALSYNDSQEEAEAACVELRAAGAPGAVALDADLADPKAARALLPRAVEALGPIGLLVNNAAVFEGPDWRAMDDREISGHMAVNYHAPLALMQEFARALPAEAAGAVVNIVDQRVWNPTPQFIAYTAAKAALWTVTRTMAQALAPRIRVNAVGPGPTLRSARQTDADFEAQWRAVPLARPTAPAEIAEAVVYLAGARAVTGQMLALDGGEHLGWRHTGSGGAPVE